MNVSVGTHTFNVLHILPSTSHLHIVNVVSDLHVTDVTA